jgi:hypothetical protein
MILLCEGHSLQDRNPLKGSEIKQGDINCRRSLKNQLDLDMEAQASIVNCSGVACDSP